jgi:AICAR transformylase/IMP cyclohydrolase PurH
LKLSAFVTRVGQSADVVGTLRPLPRLLRFSVAASRRCRPSSTVVRSTPRTPVPTLTFPGILAREIDSDLADLATHSISPITLVVCNLYPFVLQTQKPDCTIAGAVEEIDIGGVTLLRAAAKNHARVSIISSPSDYDLILSEWKQSQQISDATKRGLALKAFESTKSYDEAIADYFRKMYASPDSEENLKAGAGIGIQRLPLRYGANPHQKPAQAFVEQGEMPVTGKSLLFIFHRTAYIFRSPLWLPWLHQPS